MTKWVNSFLEYLQDYFRTWIIQKNGLYDIDFFLYFLLVQFRKMY